MQKGDIEMEYRTLANGVKMPMLGYGVFQVRDHEQCRQVVKDAISVGYRLIDTAQSYMNQKAVGEAIRESGVAREEIFLTTKIWMQDNSYEKCRKAVDLALSELDTDYIDLLLLHQPMGDYYGAWRALEEAYEAGKVRAIGMANCYPQIIADMCETVRIRPMVNQMEMHPFFQQQLTLDPRVMDSYGVVPNAGARSTRARETSLPIDTDRDRCQVRQERRSGGSPLEYSEGASLSSLSRCTKTG